MDVTPEMHRGAQPHEPAESTMQAQLFGRPLSGGEGVASHVPPIRDLLQRAPVELITWLLDQLVLLSRSDTRIQEIGLFEIAGNFNTLSVEQKQILVTKTVYGFNELPPESCTQVLRFLLQAIEIIDVLSLHEGQDNIEGLTLCEVIAQTRSIADQQSSSLDASSPFAENLFLIIEAARLHEMPPEDFESIVEGARMEALQQIEIPQFFQALTDLEEEERTHLAQSLLRAESLPDFHRSVLNEALRPGETIDKLTPGLKFVKMVKSKMWFLWTVSLCELLIAMTMSKGPSVRCSAALAKWLRRDSMISLSLAFSAWMAEKAVEPVYSKMRADPVGTMQRWQSAVANSAWARIFVALPSTSAEDIQSSCLALTWCCILLAAGNVYAVYGLLDLVAAVGCRELMVFASSLFIGIRISMVVALLFYMFFLRKQPYSRLGTDSDDDEYKRLQ